MKSLDSLVAEWRAAESVSVAAGRVAGGLADGTSEHRRAYRAETRAIEQAETALARIARYKPTSTDELILKLNVMFEAMQEFENGLNVPPSIDALFSAVKRNARAAMPTPSRQAA